MSRASFTQMDNSLHVYSNRVEPSWYQGGLAINFYEYWFLHFSAIFVSLSAQYSISQLTFSHSVREIPSPGPWRCTKTAVWRNRFGVSPAVLANRNSQMCQSTAFMHRNIWAGPCSTKDRWPVCPVLCKPNGFRLLCQHSHQCCHTSHGIYKLIHDSCSRWRCFYKWCWTDFPPFRNGKIGNSCFDSFQRSYTMASKEMWGISFSSWVTGASSRMK